MRIALRLGARCARALPLLAGFLALAGCSLVPSLEEPPHATQRVAVDVAEAARIISDYRRSKGLPPVEVDAALGAVAQRQADAMARANRLSHEVDGALPDRLATAALHPRAMVENVSAGYGSLASVVAGWQRSPRHNENLLFAPMRRMGIAEAAAPDTRYRTFWSLVMTD